MNNKQLAEFHLYHENGLVALMEKNDKRIRSAIDSGLILSGWIFAHGWIANEYHISRLRKLADMKRIPTFKLTLRINSMKSDYVKVCKLLDRLQNINPRLLRLIAEIRIKQQSIPKESEELSLKQAYRLVSKFKNPVLKKGSQNTIVPKQWECRFYDSIEQIPAYFVGYSDDICKSIKHSGWFCDNFQDTKVRGFVVRVRSKFMQYPGRFIYLSGIQTDYEFRILNYPDSIERDAALYADRQAELYAENQRENDAEFQAEMQIDELKTELHQLNKETLSIIKELKSDFKAGQYVSICKLIRSHIEKNCERRSEIFQRIDALKDNFWLSVENCY
jgi:hypothetical protein